MQKISHFWAQMKKDPKCQLGRFCPSIGLTSVIMKIHYHRGKQNLWTSGFTWLIFQKSDFL